MSAVCYMPPQVVVVFALPETPIPAATWRRGRHLFLGCRAGLTRAQFREEIAEILRPGELELVRRCLNEPVDPNGLPQHLEELVITSGFMLAINVNEPPATVEERLA